MHLRGQLQRFVILPSPRLLHFSHRLRSVQSLPSNILSSLCNPSFRMLGALNRHLLIGRCRHNFQGRDSSLPNPTSGANAKHQPRSGPRQPAFLRTGDFWSTLGSHQSRFAGSPSALRYGLSLFSHPRSGLSSPSRLRIGFAGMLRVLRLHLRFGRCCYQFQGKKSPRLQAC